MGRSMVPERRLERTGQTAGGENYRDWTGQGSSLPVPALLQETVSLLSVQCLLQTEPYPRCPYRGSAPGVVQVGCKVSSGHRGLCR